MAEKQGFSLGAWLSSFQIHWFTFWRGKKAGIDSYGNTYYVDAKRPLNGHERRWVLYKGENDASKVPPEWHGWLHYAMDAPLSGEETSHKPWIKPHLPNQTGTRSAHYPVGHQLAGGKRASTSSDYQPWQPQQAAPPEKQKQRKQEQESVEEK